MDMKFGRRGRTRNASRFVIGMVLVMLVAVSIAACGGGGSSSESGSTTTPKASASVDPKVANKTIGFVDILGVSAVEKRFYKAFSDASAVAGWNVQFVDGEGNPSKILGAAQNFVNAGVDALVFNSVPAEIVKPAVKQAKAKGIPTINLVTKATPGTYEGDYDENEAALAPVLAEKIEEDYPEGAEVGLVAAQSILSSRQRVAALEKAWEGTNIKVVDLADIPEATPDAAGKATTDMLNAHPGMNVIVGVLDQFSPSVLAAIKTSENEEVKYYSFYADAVNVPLLKRPNSPFVAVVDSNIAEVGYIAVNELLNHFATGAKLKGQYYVPLEPMIVTKENLPTGEPDEGPVPFEEIAAPFEKEWESKYGLKQEG
jgi:ribose transport system substrate-binding protein